MLEWLDQILREAGPAGLAVIAFGAFIEYVFPPFPGDTVTAFGGLYSVRGGYPPALVFAVIMAGSLAGALLDYLAGRWLAGRIDAAPEGTWYLKRLPRERIREWEERFRTRGAAWLAINRFLPAVRGPIFLAAGIARMSPLKVVGWGGLSALVWNGLLFAAGWAVGGEADRFKGLLETYGRVAWVALADIALVLIIRWWWRKRRRGRA
jgi:membrane protein DedA with SNARE-associated domain